MDAKLKQELQEYVKISTSDEFIRAMALVRKEASRWEKLRLKLTPYVIDGSINLSTTTDEGEEEYDHRLTVLVKTRARFDYVSVPDEIKADYMIPTETWMKDTKIIKKRKRHTADS